MGVGGGEEWVLLLGWQKWWDKVGGLKGEERGNIADTDEERE